MTKKRESIALQVAFTVCFSGTLLTVSPVFYEVFVWTPGVLAHYLSVVLAGYGVFILFSISQKIDFLNLYSLIFYYNSHYYLMNTL